MTTLHYAAGGGLNAQGTYAPAAAGFNLADVSSVDELNALPAGVQGLVWLNQTSGVTQSFIDAVKPFIGNPKVYGFYLADEPDPTGNWGPLVTPANLKAESDYIHANVPGAKTFIVEMNLGSSENPSYVGGYTPQNTGIDLFGIDQYPVRSDMSTVDYNMIDKAVAAAEAVGITADKIVPVFQTFGGGNWADDTGGQYVMPTAAQEQTMLAHWAALTPNAAFDYAYAWGSQNGDTALDSSPELQAVFQQHNTTTSMTIPAGSTGGSTGGSPTGSTGGSSTGSTGGSTPPVTGGTTTPTGGTTTPTGSTGGTTTGSSGGSTSTTDTGHHHHHGLDYSGLASTSTGSTTIDVSTSTTPTVTAPAVTDPVSVAMGGTGWSGGGYHVADATGGSYTDHHWHW